MKKLIAISVVFALAAGVAFAVDLGGEVFVSAKVIDADSGGDVGASGGFNRIRIEGSGEVADGKFGAWLRFDAASGQVLHGPGGTVTVGSDDYKVSAPIGAAYAWWKPIDQIKLSIGGNKDGIWGVEGYASWMFYQHASETDVVSPSNAWGGDYVPWPNRMRGAFYGGFDDDRVFIEITPVEMVNINIAIPFFAGDDIKNIFKRTDAQIALNMSFGKIAFTYQGNSEIKQSKIYGFFGLTAIDNLEIDFGLGAEFNNDNPLFIGLAMKYGADSWGIKFRTLFGIPLQSGGGLGMLFDILPYFVVNEDFRVYISGGVNFGDVTELATAKASWHVNPYIEVGGEWGPKFLAGIKVFQMINDDNKVHFAIPIALMVMF